METGAATRITTDEELCVVCFTIGFVGFVRLLMAWSGLCTIELLSVKGWIY